MSLMEKFANPEIFETLSFGDKMIGSTVTLFLGMGLTIGVLLIVWVFVVLMGKIIAKTENKTSKPVAVESVQPQEPVKTESDEQVIAAVIAAAIAAYEGSSSTSNLVVRKITRLSGNTSSWSTSAREECMASRKG